MLGLLSACSKMTSFQSSDFISQSSTGMGGLNPVPVTVYKPEPLVWESSKYPERQTWSDAARYWVDKNFGSLDRAIDIETFCPTYDKLDHVERVNAWANLFAATAYYESGWDPTDYSVDVGTKSNKDTWSVGLLQMSVVDQDNYRLSSDYSFGDLQKAEPNLRLGIEIMARQIDKKGKILIPSGESGVYWATLRPGGTYDKTASIAKMTKKLLICQN